MAGRLAAGRFSKLVDFDFFTFSQTFSRLFKVQGK